MSYLYAFLAFALLIIAHEAGHFAAAKAVGMRVEKFSLFFGPMLFKKQIGETVYGIGTIPLGGYVKITGMSEVEIAGMDFVSTDEADDVQARAYYNQPVWKRIVVIGAGPLVNLLLALLLAWVFFLGQTHYNYAPNAHAVVTSRVTNIERGSAAAQVLKKNDRIVSIDGVKGGATALTKVIAGDTCANDAKVKGCAAAKPLTIVVRRDGQLVTVHASPRYSPADHKMILGFEFFEKYYGVTTAKDGVIYSLGHSVTGLWRVTKATVSDIVQLFKAKDRKHLNGIVGAYHVTQQSFQKSTSDALEIVALISLSLGIINLFPFLPLDGGHIFWAVVEKLRGKRVSIVVMERASIVGFVLILILFVIGLSNSIHQLSH